MSESMNPGEISVQPTPSGTKVAVQRLGEGTHRELAHGVGRTAWRRDVARHAAHDDEATAGLSQAFESFMESAQYAECIGFELPPIVGHRKILRPANHAEPGVGYHDAGTMFCAASSATTRARSPSTVTSP